jgi:hypothetical protein
MALWDSPNISTQANAGDSRSVISVMGQVKSLSFDHKPSNPSALEVPYRVTPISHTCQFTVERARISGAGGFIEGGRVNGL